MTNFETRAKEICRSKGMICLVPRKGVGGISCHEKTLCDCEVEGLLVEALRQAYNDGVSDAAQLVDSWSVEPDPDAKLIRALLKKDV